MSQRVGVLHHTHSSRPVSAGVQKEGRWRRALNLFRLPVASREVCVLRNGAFTHLRNLHVIPMFVVCLCVSPSRSRERERQIDTGENFVVEPSSGCRGWLVASR